VGGLVSEADYSWTGSSNGTCRLDKLNYKRVGVQSYTRLCDSAAPCADTTAAAINHILTTGPLVSTVDAYTWSSYRGGVLSVCPSNSEQNLNHYVQIVGVDTVQGHWIVRNSWSAGWGEQGYIRLQIVSTVPVSRPASRGLDFTCHLISDKTSCPPVPLI
jgi:Papain family cysteine protease